MSGWSNPEIIKEMNALTDIWYVSSVGTVYRGRLQMDQCQAHDKRVVDTIIRLMSDYSPMPKY